MPLLDTRLEGQQLAAYGSAIREPGHDGDAAAEVAVSSVSRAVDGEECAQEDPARTG